MKDNSMKDNSMKDKLDELLELIDKDKVAELSIYFHLEKLLGKDLFVVATSRKAVYEAIKNLNIPPALWMEMCEFVGGKPGSKTTLRLVSDQLYQEVLVHKVLDFPKPQNWETAATDHLQELTDFDFKGVFWKNVKAKKIPFREAAKSLSHVGIFGPLLKIIFY